MTRHYQTDRLEQLADLSTAPSVRPEIDRSFELPTRLYALTVGAYLAFLGVMAIGFQSREMILPMAIFVAYIVMAFGVPALWTRMKPDHPSKALEWSRFTETGIETWSGRIRAGDAVLQVLILPALILLWGVTVMVIAALV